MADKNIYKLWAPKNTKWVDWVRPVPFIGISKVTQLSTNHNFKIVNINYVDELTRDTAYIVDLPDYESVIEGLGLAKKGFRPIPLYNGTTPQPNAMSLVNNNAIQEALAWGTLKLKRMEIDDCAPPVFLLDSNRLLRFKMNASIFDNSWDLYEQDIPSYEYFLKNGITKIVVRAEKVQRDLARILYKFQKKGMVILLTNGYEYPKVIRIKKPPRKDKFH